MSNQFSIIYFSMSPYSEWAIEKKQTVIGM